MKVVINSCFGGFGLSERAIEWFKNKGREVKWSTFRFDSRQDPLLVECVETLGQDANDSFANLEVIEIPDNVRFQIEEHDGMEWVSEEHRTWGRHGLR